MKPKFRVRDGRVEQWDGDSGRFAQVLRIRNGQLEYSENDKGFLHWHEVAGGSELVAAMSAGATVQQLPHSIEAEQSLLGAILNDDGAFDRIDGALDAGDFFEPVHRQMFETFAASKAEGRKLNYQLVVASLGEQIGAVDIGGMPLKQYIARLAAEATTTVNAPDFARVIAEHADRRRVIEAAQAAIHAANACDAPMQIASACMDSLDAVSARHAEQHSAAVAIGTAADRSIARMEAALERGGALQGIPTCLADIDRMLGGLQRGHLYYLAGRPGMGKSGIAVSFLRQTCEEGTNAILYSLEMSAEDISDRMASDKAFNVRNVVAYHDIRRGSISMEQAEAVVDASRALRGLSLKIDPQGGLTVAQIAARARRHKTLLESKGRTLDLVVIDHLHIIRASSRYAGNRVAEITEISASLKALAKELNVPVVALAQLSRQVETRDDKRPVLSDLRDSGSLEQDADAILFVFRESYYLSGRLDDPVKDQARIARLAEVSDRLEIEIAKNRSGPTGRVEIYFNVAANAARGNSLIEHSRVAA